MGTAKVFRAMSDDESKKSIAKAKQGRLNTLDLQLGGFCNARCGYCDTPKYNAPNGVDMGAVEKALLTGEIDWIFVCGLGEPTAQGNLDKFLSLCEMAVKNKAQVFAFTNAVEMDKKLFDHVERGTLNVLHKLDTLDYQKVVRTFGLDKTFGANAEMYAKQYLQNIHKLGEIARGQKAKDTNIGASLVVSQENIGEAPQLIKHCVDNGVAPFFGEIENAGKCVGKKFKQLVLTDEQTRGVQDVYTQYGMENYQTPFCPSQLSSVHINNNNQVFISNTGSTCTWGALEDNNVAPKIHLGDFTDLGLQGATDAIWNARFAMYGGLKNRTRNNQKVAIVGGCGGDQNEVLRKQLEITESVARIKGVTL